MMRTHASTVANNRPAETSGAAGDRADGKRQSVGERPAQRLLSLVIPTRNEAGNIEELVSRIERAIAGFPAEIIFVDDSTDDTPAVVSEVSRRSRLPVSLIHRPPESRGNGLGGAVVEGMRAATGQWVCVMDADLQHPPEVIPSLLEQARRTGAEIVVASRYA